VCVAGVRPDGVEHVEVVDRRRGTGWLVERVAELSEAHSPVAVACDGAGAAASFVPQLADVGVEVETLSTRDYANACGEFFDVVDQGRLRHLGTSDLESAIRGAARRNLGDAWAWSRRSSKIDISPLVSATIARWARAQAKPPVPARYRTMGF